MRNRSTQLAKVAAEEKEKGNKAISLGDPNNTIIFVKKDKKVSEAKGEFLAKLKGRSALNIESAEKNKEDE